jgi:hypothetical protein
MRRRNARWMISQAEMRRRRRMLAPAFPMPPREPPDESSGVRMIAFDALPEAIRRALSACSRSINAAKVYRLYAREGFSEAEVLEWIDDEMHGRN